MLGAGKALGEFVGDWRRLPAGELLERRQHTCQFTPVYRLGLGDGAMQNASAERVELIATESRRADRRGVTAPRPCERRARAGATSGRRARCPTSARALRRSLRRPTRAARTRAVDTPRLFRSRNRGGHVSIRASRATKPAGVRTTVTGIRQNLSLKSATSSCRHGGTHGARGAGITSYGRHSRAAPPATCCLLRAPRAS